LNFIKDYAAMVLALLVCAVVEACVASWNGTDFNPVRATCGFAALAFIEAREAKRKIGGGT
jgi:hypothetical protein